MRQDQPNDPTGGAFAAFAFIACATLMWLAFPGSVAEQPKEEAAHRAAITEPDPVVPVVEPEPERVLVDERTHCLSSPVDAKLMAKVMQAYPDRRHKSRFLLWEDDYGNDDRHPDNVRVVFVRNGIRYTVWHRPPYTLRLGDTRSDESRSVAMDPWIAVWERPNGTHGDEELITYSDDLLTGCVNFGVGDNLYRLLRWNDKSSKDEGLENHAFWQERYQMAINALADVLQVR